MSRGGMSRVLLTRQQAKKEENHGAVEGVGV